jgi:hypothetical protein
MTQLVTKSFALKFTLTLATMTFAIVNLVQSNVFLPGRQGSAQSSIHNKGGFSFLSIQEARAQEGGCESYSLCITAPNYACGCYTQDGLYHMIVNAEYGN